MRIRGDLLLYNNGRTHSSSLEWPALEWVQISLQTWAGGSALPPSASTSCLHRGSGG